MAEQRAESPEKEPSWSDLERDEKRLALGRVLLWVLRHRRAMYGLGDAREPRVLSGAEIRDALVGLRAYERDARGVLDAVTRLQRGEGAKTLARDVDEQLDELADELDEALAEEERLLASER